MIKFKLQIEQLLKQATPADIFYIIGKIFVKIKLTVVKYKTL